jgi:hypothetical protein
MARRKNPWVTLAMFTGLCGFGYAAYYGIYEKKLFENQTVVQPPVAEMERLRTAIDDAMGADECYAGITMFTWRETSKRYRIDVNMTESCGVPQAKALARRVSEVIERTSTGKYEAEVALLILGREVWHYVP